MLKIAFVIVSIFFSMSCAGPKPVTDYSLSKTALDYAKNAGAETYASGWYFKADTLFKKAEKAYELNDNEVARNLFIKARKYAERAENTSKLKKFKSGDGPIE